MFSKRGKRVCLALFQHVEGLREGQLAEHVDDEEGKPGLQVDRLAVCGCAVQACNQLGEAAVNVRLHLRHGLEGEAGSQRLFSRCVDGLVSRAEDVGAQCGEGIVERTGYW